MMIDAKFISFLKYFFSILFVFHIIIPGWTMENDPWYMGRLLIELSSEVGSDAIQWRITIVIS